MDQPHKEVTALIVLFATDCALLLFNLVFALYISARYFCRLPTDFEMHDGSGPAAPAVLRETKHFEATWEDLANASDPKLLRNAHKDADASAATFESLAPDHVKHFKVEKLALVPAAP